MKNQKEIYEALLAGEILDNGDFTVQLGIRGTLLDDEDCPIHLTFSNPSEWRIYKEPKWYENIPEGGVLCWVGDNKVTMNEKKAFRIILDTRKSCSGFKAAEGYWEHATPLTQKEIQVFMDNAPDEL